MTVHLQGRDRKRMATTAIEQGPSRRSVRFFRSLGHGLTRLLRVVLALALLLAGFLFLLHVMNWNWLRPTVARLTESWLGTPLVIEGDLDVDLFPHPSVTMEKASLGAAPGGTRAGGSFSAERFSAEVAFLPLFAGKLKILKVALAGAEVRPVELAGLFSGSRSPRDDAAQSPADRATGDLVPGSLSSVAVEDLVIRDVAVLLPASEGGRSVAVQIDKLDGEIAGLPGDIRLRGEGSLSTDRGARQPWSLAAAVELTDARTLKGDVNLNAPGLDVAVQGTLGLRPKQEATQLSASVDVANPDSLLRLLGIRLGDVPALHAEATVVGADGVWRADDIAMKLGKSRLTGAVSYAMTPRPRVEADLEVGLLRYRDIAALMPKNGASPARKRARATKDGTRGIDRSAGSPTLPDARLALQIKEITGPGAIGRLSGATLKARIDDGRVLIDRFELLAKERGRQILHVTAEGRVDRPLALADVQLDVSAKGQAIAPLTRALGYAPGPVPPFEVSARIEGSQSSWRLPSLRVQAGESLIEGSATFDLRGKEPFVGADLTSSLVRWADVAPFLPEEGAPSGKTGRAKPTLAGVDQRLSGWRLPTRPLPVDLLRSVEGRVGVTIDRLIGPEGRVLAEGLRSSAQLLQGRLEVETLRAELLGGAMGANLVAEAVGDEVKARVDLGWRDMRTAPVVKPATDDLPLKDLRVPNLIRARVTGNLQMTTQGGSVRELVQRADGALRMTSDDGHVSALVIEALGIDITEALMVVADDKPPTTAIKCLYADLGLKSGALRADRVLLSTVDSNVRVYGSVNLVNGNADLTIRTLPKDFSVGSLRAPFDIKGPLTSAPVKLRRGPLIMRVVSALALGILINPLAAALPLLDFSPGQENVCQAYEPQIAALNRDTDRLLEGGTEIAH